MPADEELETRKETQEALLALVHDDCQCGIPAVTVELIVGKKRVC